MEKDRLTAITDGVIAVIITIMVLEMKAPSGAGLPALLGLWPVFLSYVLSFIYVAIYWNNHHHLFQLVSDVTGGILWANMNLLFWLSLVPFTTAWMGENAFSPIPTALYGVSLLMPAIAWTIMQTVIMRAQGTGSALRRAIGADAKGRLSLALYVSGIGMSFVSAVAADCLYMLVAMMWLIPDRRIEKSVRSGA